MNRVLSRLTFEWPTFFLLLLCYAVWALGTTVAAQLWLPLGVGLAALAAALHSSLSHEMLHGHPTSNPLVNAALVFPALSVSIPYLRFQDMHLAHHQDAVLTDPYDDPESNYTDPAVWARLPVWFQSILKFNNSLLGRLLVGPLLGQIVFVKNDLQKIRRGHRHVLWGWLVHLPALAVVVWWMVNVASLPIYAWLLSAYLAHAILKIRTFLEHQAHEHAGGRTVIIEDKGPLALIFLNNNLHAVHHMHPNVPWYRLPMLYAAKRDSYLTRNQGYCFRSYGEIFRRYFVKSKDPVPHPLWPKP
ncbi:MAG: fatty acid desaturase [Rhodobacteraceae bacterium]|nr:fatty acid desaturase [Paracoccaceae bacterium]